VGLPPDDRVAKGVFRRLLKHRKVLTSGSHQDWEPLAGLQSLGCFRRRPPKGAAPLGIFPSAVSILPRLIPLMNT
jgi:hypothetical protein